MGTEEQRAFYDHVAGFRRCLVTGLRFDVRQALRPTVPTAPKTFVFGTVLDGYEAVEQFSGQKFCEQSPST